MELENGINNPGFQIDEEISMETISIPRPQGRKDRNRHRNDPPPPYPPSSTASNYFDQIRDTRSTHRGSLQYPVDTFEVENEPLDHEIDYSLWGIFKNTKAFQNFQNKFPFLQDKNLPKKIFLSILALFYVIYFVFVLVRHSKIQEEDYWCRGDGFLIIITAFVTIGLLYFKIVKPYIMKSLQKEIQKSPLCKRIHLHYDEFFSFKYTNFCIYIMVAALMVGYVVYDAEGNKTRLVSLIGIAVFLLFGFIFSTAPFKIRWRHVVWGMSLQFLFGLLILRWDLGEATFDCLGAKVQTFLEFTDKGSSFVFGQLVSEYGIFAFKVLSVIIFFSLFIQILYYYGIMQWLVIKLGWLLQITIGTTACESVNASANIFLGQSEAPLLIKPFLNDMTNSELHAVMTGGFATIAGTVLAAYISFDVDASHLLSASVMSAPAALAYSKLFFPETEISKTSANNIKVEKGKETNALHAALEGVTAAIPLVANIAANLLAFIAFVAFIDSILNWICLLVSVEDGVCNLTNIFGYVFMPIAWLMGVPWIDCYDVGQLIGTKTVINEFVAYINLQTFIKAKKLTKRSEVIATYALCGFSNISSMGIQLGSLGAMAPSRRGDLSKIVVRAMIAGNIACFLTACIAGCLLSFEEFEQSDGNFELYFNATDL